MELRFASAEEALQHLANITGRKIKVASDEWKILAEKLSKLKDEIHDAMSAQAEKIGDDGYSKYEKFDPEIMDNLDRAEVALYKRLEA